MVSEEKWFDITTLMGSGVYLLLYKGDVVYVGQSVKLSGRVNAHIAYLGQRLQKKKRRVVFDEVMVMQVPLGDLNRVEAELIQRYKPQYNIRQPKQRIPLTAEIKELLGLIIPELPPSRDTPQRYIQRRL